LSSESRSWNMIAIASVPVNKIDKIQTQQSNTEIRQF
jgi:hypothetical protein